MLEAERLKAYYIPRSGLPGRGIVFYSLKNISAETS
jgi:hypothetical protein